MKYILLLTFFLVGCDTKTTFSDSTDYKALAHDREVQLESMKSIWAGLALKNTCYLDRQSKEIFRLEDDGHKNERANLVYFKHLCDYKDKSKCIVARVTVTTEDYQFLETLTHNNNYSKAKCP